MEVITQSKQLQKIADKLRAEGKTVGLVPTMGFLHDGHLSLIRACHEKCDVTIVSVFVNPTQFAPNEDFSRYPRDLEKDKNLLTENSVDYLFLPDRDEIYSDIFKTYVEVHEISKVLEGKFRPEHFKGVTTVVAILFNIAKPHYAFFGQKDAQQVTIISQMTEDLHFDVKIEICPIVREKDGLAMSSRNIYLSVEERKTALTLYNSLLYGTKFFEGREMNPQVIIDNMQNCYYDNENIILDYISIVNARDFREPLFIEQGNEYYLLVAARVGKTRLIDNFFISLYP